MDLFKDYSWQSVSSWPALSGLRYTGNDTEDGLPSRTGDRSHFAMPPTHIMVVVTGQNIDPKLIPLGIVVAEGYFAPSLKKRLENLIEELIKAAPSGTTHLFNVKYEEYQSNPGEWYCSGFADAYTKPNM